MEDGLTMVVGSPKWIEATNELAAGNIDELEYTKRLVDMLTMPLVYWACQHGWTVEQMQHASDDLIAIQLAYVNTESSNMMKILGERNE